MCLLFGRGSICRRISATLMPKKRECSIVGRLGNLRSEAAEGDVCAYRERYGGKGNDTGDRERVRLGEACEAVVFRALVVQDFDAVAV